MLNKVIDHARKWVAVPAAVSAAVVGVVLAAPIMSASNDAPPTTAVTAPEVEPVTDPDTGSPLVPAPVEVLPDGVYLDAQGCRYTVTAGVESGLRTCPNQPGGVEYDFADGDVVGSFTTTFGCTIYVNSEGRETGRVCRR